MKESAAYQASAGQQTVETTVGAAVPAGTGADQPRSKAKAAAAAPGLTFPRFFTEAGVDPFAEVEWELRAALIGNEKGELVFEQRDVEIPRSWSQQATNIVVSKYFRGQIGTAERESSVKQLIGRVVNTITQWARAQKYFAGDEDLQAFSDDLKHILVYQKAAFNSPVWFNCGFEKAPQCSACFINSVQDTMDSILKLAHTEGMLFKFGSGTGTNLSPIRSSRELLAGGAHVCGNPGMQFDSTINEWHTCPATERFYASNPCSEYMFLNDSACNLASMNLMKFVKADGELDVSSYKAAIRTLITAQEIIVDNASYPTAAIEKNSHAFRP